MKKLLWIISALILASCSTPKNSVTGFQYDGSKVCVQGKIVIYAPTVTQIDSALKAISQNIISFEHVKDSVGIHVYNYKLCTPPLSNK